MFLRGLNDDYGYIMKLTFISDTHLKHHNLDTDSGDILIHCGDFTRQGDLSDTVEFAGFLSAQDFTHKMAIAGNHDRCFEDKRRLQAEAILSDHGIIYLNDSGIEIDGVNFWGSPVQPEFLDWAFNRKRGVDLLQHWMLIPENTDVLLTHGPAYSILDLCTDGRRVGCEDLLRTIERIKPKIHAFGHIHESYGQYEYDGTLCINACNLDERYLLRNSPIVVEI